MFNWARKLFRRKSSAPANEPQDTKKSRLVHFETEPKPSENRLNEEIKKLRQARIRIKNQTRRSQFSNAEHFKRRQPTTGRQLWKPNAKLEEE